MYYDLTKEGGYGGVQRLQHNIDKVDKKSISQWLKTQPTYSLHKPLRKKFPTRKYKVNGINDVWQMDLMEMIPFARVNKGFKYILTCIDVFSRKAYAQPVKSKNAVDVMQAIEKVIKQTQPRHIQTDLGKEFYNKNVKELLKRNGIKHYSVNSQFKCALVERFNRTLREKLTRYFTHRGHKIWYDVLQKIVDTYNKSKHRGIFGLRPIEVNAENEHQLWEQMQSLTNSQKSESKELPLLNYVRISQISTNMPFKRNFKQNWSEEVFQIIAIDKHDKPTMYTIQDLNNEVIEGKFYREELQDIGPLPPTEFRIEKIIRSKGKGKHKQYLVKWHGYVTPTWISAQNIVKPKHNG